MKKNMLQISPRYIVDDSGKKKEVILDIKIYEKLLEELEDYYLGLEADKAFKDGDFIDFFEVNKDIVKK